MPFRPCRVRDFHTRLLHRSFLPPPPSALPPPFPLISSIPLFGDIHYPDYNGRTVPCFSPECLIVRLNWPPISPSPPLPCGLRSEFASAGDCLFFRVRAWYSHSRSLSLSPSFPRSLHCATSGVSIVRDVVCHVRDLRFGRTLRLRGQVKAGWVTTVKSDVFSRIMERCVRSFLV